MSMDLSSLTPQQRDVVGSLDEPLFVSAGAGSGKTFTLTQRILWALSPESGPYIDHVDQVLAITFTKKAAAEIRERVRTALLDAGMQEEALAVDDAWISTIHGMCSRILKENALELGIDPEFTVVEDVKVDALKDRAVDHVLERARLSQAQAKAGAAAEDGEEPQDYSALFDWYKLIAEKDPSGREAGTSLRTILSKLLDEASIAPHGFDDLHLQKGKIDFSGLRSAYTPCLSATPKAAETAQNALEAISFFEHGAQSKQDLIDCMEACDKMPSASKSLAKEDVDRIKAESADAFVNAYLAVDEDALDELMDLARQVFDEYGRLKAEESLLDNSDLLRLTQQAFREHESLREEYADRFKLVMVDEFQDTDQQQVEVIKYLAGAGGQRLCTVGDAQQSIYRFRGAEVEVFRRQQRALEEGAGRVTQLTKNFRSHPEVLGYVKRIFDDSTGGIMPDFLDLEPDKGRKDGLVAAGAARRQAVFVAGGSAEERRQAKAAAIARRFRALADAGQPLGDMVLLLGAMTNSDIYAQAFRDAGLDCVISGGSVFSRMPEVKAVRALACTLANPKDTAQGLVPLLQSPMFALGAEEFLALTSKHDLRTGAPKRRGVYEGLMSDEDEPAFGRLPLLERAREVLRRALARVGHDPFATIARDAVEESGWMERLHAAGPEGQAQAANVLKALDALEQAEAKLGRSPRRIALDFDEFLESKQAPGALNAAGGDAVRIMTVHSSKGLEFPVVAVAECFSIRKNSEMMQLKRDEYGQVRIAALPDRFPKASAENAFDKYLKGTKPWLTPDQLFEVSVGEDAAADWVSLRAESDRLELEEQARLLYVACTRAREVLLLAMDAGVGSEDKVPVLKIDDETDLTGSVLERILPGQGACLQYDAGRLCLEDSRPGDCELICLEEFRNKADGSGYAANAAIVDGKLVAIEEAEADEAAKAEGDADEGAGTDEDEDAPDSFTLVWPGQVDYGVFPSARAPRASYSYSSLSRELHAQDEDRAAAPEPAESAAEDDEVARAPAEGPGSAVALGSAFHAAAQWMVETGSDRVPVERVDALARYWQVTPEQRLRLDAALARWCGSDIRREALGWPCLRAEVPFYSLGAEELAEHGAYAEGAIDLLCTDPARPERALLIDYKTGGSPDETPEQLQEKHALQAQVYADVLHKAGWREVSLRFVRVEIDDPERPGQPQVVCYEL